MLLQLPLGAALDDWGPRRVEPSLLALAVTGLRVFTAAGDFVKLVLARTLIGMGVRASPDGAPDVLPWALFFAVRAAACGAIPWMLMTGSLGMVALDGAGATAVAGAGWRGLFWALVRACFRALGGGRRVALRWRMAAADGARLVVDRRWRAYAVYIVRHLREFVRMAADGAGAPRRHDRHAGVVGLALADPGLRLDAGGGQQRAVADQRRHAAGLPGVWGLGDLPALTRRGLAVNTLLAWGWFRSACRCWR
ncbi:MAG: hypothetical protein IPM99_06200 [Rubrivivax sp.]|nr:hypothetical protein [Rubrivivax sp.]